MGILIAIPIVVAGSADVLAVPDQWRFGGWLGLIIIAAIGALLYRLAVKPRPAG